jgi:type II secretion system protein G
MYAVSGRNLEGSRILISAGASRDIKDRQGRSALDLVLSKTKLNIIVDDELEALRTEKERAFLLDSRTAKKVLGEFQEYEEAYGTRKQAPLSRKTEITDVGLVSPPYNNRSEIKVWFGSIDPDALSKRDSGNERSLFGKSTPQFEVLIKWELGYRSLLFLDSQERDRCFQTLKQALNAWRSRYGDPARIPNPDAEKMAGQSTSGTLNSTSTAEASKQMAASAPKTDDAQRTRVMSDLQNLGSSLMLYYARFAQYPTMEQGLDALVKEPTVGPIPYKWMQLQVSIPKDPWNNEYRFRIPTTSKSPRDVFDVFSLGPDGIVSGDDIIVSR